MISVVVSRNFLLKDFDRRVLLSVSGFTGATPDELLSLYLPYLVRRINLLNSRLSGEGLDTLLAMPQPELRPAGADGPTGSNTG